MKEKAESGTSLDHSQLSNKMLTLPLMSKKLNSVEKYVNAYKISAKNSSVLRR